MCEPCKQNVELKEGSARRVAAENLQPPSVPGHEPGYYELIASAVVYDRPGYYAQPGPGGPDPQPEYVENPQSTASQDYPQIAPIPSTRSSRIQQSAPSGENQSWLSGPAPDPRRGSPITPSNQTQSSGSRGNAHRGGNDDRRKEYEAEERKAREDARRKQEDEDRRKEYEAVQRKAQEDATRAWEQEAATRLREQQAADRRAAEQQTRSSRNQQPALPSFFDPGGNVVHGVPGMNNREAIVAATAYVASDVWPRVMTNQTPFSQEYVPATMIAATMCANGYRSTRRGSSSRRGGSSHGGGSTGQDRSPRHDRSGHHDRSSHHDSSSHSNKKRPHPDR